MTIAAIAKLARPGRRAARRTAKGKVNPAVITRPIAAMFAAVRYSVMESSTGPPVARIMVHVRGEDNAWVTGTLIAAYTTIATYKDQTNHFRRIDDSIIAKTSVTATSCQS